MKIKATKLIEDINKIFGYGADKIESNNLIITKDSDNTLIFIVSSRSVNMQYNSGITLPEGDNLTIKHGISIASSNFKEIVSGMGEKEIDISDNKDNEDFIKISTKDEIYDISIKRLSEENVHEVKIEVDSSAKMLFDNESRDIVKPVSTMISNVNQLCTNSEFRTVIYRKNNRLKVILITNTTLNTYTKMLRNKDKNDEYVGIDTNIAYPATIFSTVVSRMKENDKISVKYTNKIIYIESNEVRVAVSYVPKNTDISESEKMYKNIMNMINRPENTKTVMKISSRKLKEIMQKTSSIMSKSATKRIDTYIPIKMENSSTVSIDYKCVNGSYKTTHKNNVDIDGLGNKPSIYNLNVVIMKSILDTLIKNYKERAKLSKINTASGKKYVEITCENNDETKYIMRLRN